MKRISKIVERGKSVLATSTPSPISERETVKSNLVDISYTETQKAEIDKSTLIENRLIALDPTDARAMRFQILRTKVLQQMRKKNWNTLGICAPTEGAGKSLVSSNLAISIAMEGNQSVLLVDMDLRKPSIHRYFEILPQNGLHDILDGQATLERTLVNPSIERLVLLPGRKAVLNSSEQISTPFVKNLVEQVKNRYQDRIVIFDLPPILLTDDVMVFLPYIDCSLLVVEAGKNDKKQVDQAITTIDQNPLLGTILNKSDAPLQKSIY